MLWLKKSRQRNLALLIGVVLLPMAVLAFYLLAVAQNRYVSASTVVVKQVGESGGASLSGIGALLGGVSTNAEDLRFLRQYIESPDMLNALDKRLNLRRAFAGNGRDWVYQMPADANREEFLAYYRKRVSVNLDDQTNLLNVSSEGFDPQFALRLNQEILSLSEAFINNISRRLAEQQLAYSQQQLRESTERLNAARQAVLSYQNRTDTIDPALNVSAISKLVMSLQTDLAGLQTQERTLLAYLNADAPQVVAIRSQIRAVEQQIAQEQAKLTSTGGGGARLNSQSAEFEALKAKLDFEADLYKLALGGIEKARMEAARKMKNLIVISSPQLADAPTYPRRGYLLLSTLMVLLMLYGFLRLALAVIREHRD